MTNNQKHFWSWVAVGVCLVFLATLLYITLLDLFTLERSGYIRPVVRRHFLSSPHSIQVSQFRGWMTFGYINQQFKLPADYLKTALNITSKKYPNISIDALASQQKMDSGKVLLNVQKAVQNYLNQSQTSK